MQAAGWLLQQGPLRQGRALPPAGEAAVPVGTEAEQEVDFKEVSEEQALSILKVGPAAAAAPAPLARPGAREAARRPTGWLGACISCWEAGECSSGQRALVCSGQNAQPGPLLPPGAGAAAAGPHALVCTHALHLYSCIFCGSGAA